MVWEIDVDDASSAPIIGTPVSLSEPMGYIQTYYGIEEIRPLSEGKIVHTCVNQGDDIVKGELVAFIQR